MYFMLIIGHHLDLTVLLVALRWAASIFLLACMFA